MLVYDIQAVLVFYQPVGLKYLADQPVLCTYFPLQEIFFEKIELYGLLPAARKIPPFAGASAEEAR